jgi:hypothetical protein
MKRVALLALMVAFDAVPAAAAESEAPPHGDALTAGRLELRPYAAWAAIPNSVTGPFVGADVAFHLSPVVALGVDAAWYAPFNRSAGTAPAYPLNETRDSVDLDVSVSPWPAYRAGALEPYVLAGLGAQQSRPIGLEDPANRSFSYNTLVDLAFGLGVHFFGKRPVDPVLSRSPRRWQSAARGSGEAFRRSTRFAQCRGPSAAASRLAERAGGRLERDGERRA